MAETGSFRSCFSSLIEKVGIKPSRRMAIIYDIKTGLYALVSSEEGKGMLRRDDEDEGRIVVDATYYELKELIKPRQLDIFKEVKNGNKP